MLFIIEGLVNQTLSSYVAFNKENTYVSSNKIFNISLYISPNKKSWIHCTQKKKN